MAYHKDTRKLAFQMFERHIENSEISRQLNVALRTVQRWRLKWQSLREESKPDTGDIHTEELKTQLETAGSALKHGEVKVWKESQDDSEQWLKVAPVIGNEHCSQLYVLRHKFFEVLTDEMESSEMSAKRITSLYRCFHQCVALEREAASLEYLDINRATELVYKHHVKANDNGQDVTSESSDISNRELIEHLNSLYG